MQEYFYEEGDVVTPASDVMACEETWKYFRMHAGVPQDLLGTSRKVPMQVLSVENDGILRLIALVSGAKPTDFHHRFVVRSTDKQQSVA